MTDNRREMLIFPIAAVVAVGWFASLIIGAYTGSYIALTLTSPIMFALAGYTFGVNLVRKAGGNGD